MKQEYKYIAQYVLAALGMIALFFLLWVLAKVEIPEDNKDILHIVAGAVIAAVVQVFNYFFGSSKGSADKTDIMVWLCVVPT